MKNKIITRLQLFKWFEQGILDPRRASKATKKNHKHQHREVFLPGKPNITPAEYRRRSKKKGQKDAVRRKKARIDKTSQSKKLTKGN